MENAEYILRRSLGFGEYLNALLTRHRCRVSYQRVLDQIQLPLVTVPATVWHMITIAVTNFKGGSGKSTMSVGLANELARSGYQVLLVDADPQGHATIYAREERSGEEVVRALESDRPLIHRCLKTRLHGDRVRVFPAGTETARINRHLVLRSAGTQLLPELEQELRKVARDTLEGGGVRSALEGGGASRLAAEEAAMNAADRLDKSLNIALSRFFSENLYVGRSVGLGQVTRDASIRDHFDVCVIDTPPTLTDLVGDIAMHADFYLVVAKPEGMSYFSVHQLVTYLAKALSLRGVPDYLHPNYVGLLMNQVSSRKEEQSMLRILSDDFGPSLLRHYMPSDSHIPRCASYDPPRIFNLASRKSPSAIAMQAITKELIDRIPIPQPRPSPEVLP
ncbi:MAG: ParA family protein [Planctomycetota bacterium]|nr:MAG: ParA family protein [Planctomycetota bacterium]